MDTLTTGLAATVTGGVAAFVPANSPLAGQVVQVQADDAAGVAGGADVEGADTSGTEPPEEEETDV